jgi:transposase
MDLLEALRVQAGDAVIRESKKHRGCKLLRTVPGIGAIRAATIVAHVCTPFRFRTKRQFWSYCGLAVVTWSSDDWEIDEGKLRRSRRPIATRGLNRNHNRHLKSVFKSAVHDARAFRPHFEALVASGMRESMARLTVARKIAATSLAIWKKGQAFDLSKAVVRSV